MAEFLEKLLGGGSSGGNGDASSGRGGLKAKAVIPPGSMPGMQFPLNLFGQSHMVTCPPGMGPGMQLEIAIDADGNLSLPCVQQPQPIQQTQQPGGAAMRMQQMQEQQMQAPQELSQPPSWRCAGDGPGLFFPFDAAVAAMFEQALPTKSSVTWHDRGFNYFVDWSTMEQVNMANSTRRGIERVVGGRVTHPDPTDR